MTTVTCIRKLAKARLSKRAAVERRSWPKFGDAVHEDVGSRLTMVSTEEIVLNRPRAPARDPLAQVGKKGAILMVCRTCGKKGDHWTSKCLYKDIAPQTEAFVDKPTMSEPTAGKSSAYEPPSMRGAAAKRTRTEMRRRNEENSVSVTNLSEDTHEPDLLELFCIFGLVSHVYVAIDLRTGLSRGFGFVDFVRKEDAERATSKFNGYIYDTLSFE